MENIIKYIYFYFQTFIVYIKIRLIQTYFYFYTETLTMKMLKSRIFSFIRQSLMFESIFLKSDRATRFNQFN